jgi:hypothetical protein
VTNFLINNKLLKKINNLEKQYMMNYNKMKMIIFKIKFKKICWKKIQEILFKKGKILKIILNNKCTVIKKLWGINSLECNIKNLNKKLMSTICNIKIILSQ